MDEVYGNGSSSGSSALGGFGATIGSFMDFALNNALADLAARRQFGFSKQMFDYTFDKQNQRQDFLNFMSGTIQKQSLKNAGLSAANLNGAPFSPNVASGAGISGSAEFAQANFFNAMLQAKQLQIQDKMADADVAVKEQEAERIRKENGWYDTVQKTKLDTEKLTQDLLRNQSKEIQEMLPMKIKELTANVDLTNLNKSFEQLRYEAANRIYKFGDKEVKGSEIENFNLIFALEMAQKTMAIDWYKARTERMALDRDWKAVLTREWLVPLVNYLTPKLKEFGENIAPEVREKIETTLKDIQGIIDDAKDTAGEVSEMAENPFVYFANKETDRLRANIRKYGESRGMRYDKNGKAIYNKH